MLPHLIKVELREKRHMRRNLMIVHGKGEVMVQNNNRRPNRHSNPSNQAKHMRHGGGYLFIKKKNRAVREVLREMV